MSAKGPGSDMRSNLHLISVRANPSELLDRNSGAQILISAPDYASLQEDKGGDSRAYMGTSNLDGVAASVRRAIGAGLGGPGL